MKKVAVSIHAVDNFTVEILKDIKGFDYIHVDVMDGKFVNNTNSNLNVFRTLKETYQIPIIAHLMVINPIEYIEKIIDFVDFFVFHFEVDDDKSKIIEEIRKTQKKVGFALNPETKISKIVPYLKEIDIVLIMSVNPGWSGQKFIPNTIDRVYQLAEYKKNFDFLIDVDGGINLTNSKLLKKTDILSSSSTILKAKEPNKIIKLLKESDQNT
jgi:ribulose-phosphate 3-epimerase